MKPLLRILLCIAGLLAATACLAKLDPLEPQRKLFLEARQALHDNKQSRFEKLAGQLEDYPLYPYLQFDLLRTRLNRAREQEITGFLKKYSELPLSRRLRISWLYSLARNRKWELFLKHYTQTSSVELQCYRLQALLHTDAAQDVIKDALKLWLVGKSQPGACDPVFEFLDKNGHITNALRWERIRLAMQNNQTSLADFLSRDLPAADRALVSLWRAAHSQPAKTLDDPALEGDTPMTREIILHAIARIARADAAQAHARWQSLKPGYHFTQADIGQMDKKIALSAAWQRDPQAHDWLSAVPADAVDRKVREWRTRSAISVANWAAVLEHINGMTAEDAWTEEWRYWQAVAQENTDQRLKAMDGFALLAKERDYHGFLAADYLRWPYVMGNKPLDTDPELLASIAARPAFVRTRELYLAALTTDARREWAQAIEDLSNAEIKAAAALAREWGWNDRAILTVARSRDFSDLVLRFPVEHEDTVRRYAESNQLDPGHVFAVIRQESAFNTEARSSAGALGLMQLMPGTGRVTARKHRIALPSTRKLLEADKNIRIGTAYLRQVMERFGGNAVLASAAYNAGPHRVQRWLPETEAKDAARWIADIPFTETRKYVQRVLTYAAIYDWRLQRPVTPLAKRMLKVMPAQHYTKTGS